MAATLLGMMVVAVLVFICASLHDETPVMVTACAAIFVITLAAYSIPSERDDTDPPNGRSGMSLHTDAKTGCQYLSKSGTLTPRLDATGKPTCGSAK